MRLSAFTHFCAWPGRAGLALALALTAIAAQAGELRGRVVAVADGDTLTILAAGNQQIRIRLAEIDAPEKRQAFGQRSKQSLSDLCFGRDAVNKTALPVL